MNGSKRRIATLIAGVGLAVTAGGVTAAMAAGSNSPSVTPVSVSSAPGLSDDGTADQGHGDVTIAGTQTAMPSIADDDGTADQGHGDATATGDDHGDHRGPGHGGEDRSGHGHGEDDRSGHDGPDDDHDGHGEGAGHS
jgi:hypothetical protein